MDFESEAMETLRNARFPVYLVPPSQWDGDVMLRGTWGSRKHPLSITISYDDDLDRIDRRPLRRIDITSVGIEGLGHRSPTDRYLLWEHGYHVNIVNFVHNVSTQRLRERPIPGSERYNATEVDGKLVPRVVYLPSAGPRQLIDAQRFANGYLMERIGFEDYPELRMYRVQMPEVEVLLLSWGRDDESLLKFMQSAKTLREDEKLLAEIERAEHAAWEKIRERKQRNRR